MYPYHKIRWIIVFMGASWQKLIQKTSKESRIMATEYLVSFVPRKMGVKSWNKHPYNMITPWCLKLAVWNVLMVGVHCDLKQQTASLLIFYSKHFWKVAIISFKMSYSKLKCQSLLIFCSKRGYIVSVKRTGLFASSKFQCYIYTYWPCSSSLNVGTLAFIS